MAKTNATQRSLKELRENGWIAHVVEKWINIPNAPGGGKRIDVWGFGDILACRPRILEEAPCPSCKGSGLLTSGDERYRGLSCGSCAGRGHKLLHEKVIALIQCFPNTGGTGFADHRAKVLAIKEAEIWIRAGGKIFLQGWRKGGPRGAVKHWQMKQEEVVLARDPS